MFYSKGTDEKNNGESDNNTLYGANIAYTVLAIITLCLEFVYLKKRLQGRWVSTFCEMLGAIFTQAIPLSSGVKLIYLNKELKKTQPEIMLIERRTPSYQPPPPPPLTPVYIPSTYGGKGKGKNKK
jgi:hypothetical protein